MARPPLSLGELIEHWTLVGKEIDLVSAKHLDIRLAFALLLKFYGRHGRFPRSRGELHPDAVEFVARALKADPASVAAYDWSGRSIERHHGQIRRHFGFRVCGEAEGEKLAKFLAGDFTQRERRYDMVREQFLGECRVQQLEPPTADQVDRYVRTALFQGARLLTGRITGRLSGQSITRLLALIGTSDDGEEEDPDLLRMIKAAPGTVTLASMLAEIDKLTAIGSFGLPEGLFRDVVPRVLKEWRDQAMTESPSHLRDHADDLKVALLAALLFCRRREITDALVTLLISTVHRIGARAERRVTTELVNAFRRVQGKEALLFRVADAALSRPDDSVRRVVFPVVGKTICGTWSPSTSRPAPPTGARCRPPTVPPTPTTTGLVRLLEVLQFRSEDSHQPVLEAVQLVRRYAASPQLTYCPEGESVPVHGGLSGDWQDLAYRTDGRGHRRVVRTIYEIRTFEALVDQRRCKGIWVLGAEEFRNPDEDLVTDFAERRTEHYAGLRKPLDPRAFIAELQGELRRELQALDGAVPGLPWLEISPRGRQGAIRLTPLDAAPEPTNLGRLKKAIAHRWGMLRLIDVLKEAVLRSGCLQVIERSSGRGGRLGPGELLERLLLVIYAYGTGAGIRAVAAADRGPDDRGPDEHDLYYARRWYLTTELAEALAVQIANATFAARHKAVWGEGSSAVASDSTHFGAWDQNLFTEWHSRYGGRGVLIYWHIERKSMVIHSQLLGCTASEVAAMIQGAIHHGTEMDVKANYVDTHGQSVVGFGLTRLLGFDLLPRIKRINHIRLYPPARGEEFPNLASAMVGRAIDWDLIAAQYDDVIKYATSIKSNAASTTAILRRFHRTNLMHPTYQAIQEIGRAQRTIFACRYLQDRDLQREVNAALNVAESWNAGNAVLHYGKGGDIPGNRRDEQELTVLCLRVLQASVPFLNTLLIQDVLADGDLRLAAEDQRAITPLFWSHIAPYGEVTLDMTRRISLSNDTIPDGEQTGT